MTRPRPPKNLGDGLGLVGQAIQEAEAIEEVEARLKMTADRASGALKRWQEVKCSPSQASRFRYLRQETPEILGEPGGESLSNAPRTTSVYERIRKVRPERMRQPPPRPTAQNSQPSRVRRRARASTADSETVLVSHGVLTIDGQDVELFFRSDPPTLYLAAPVPDGVTELEVGQRKYKVEPVPSEVSLCLISGLSLERLTASSRECRWVR